MMIGSLRIVEHCLMPWFRINMSRLSETAENHLINMYLFDELGVSQCWMGFILHFSDVKG